MQDDGDAEDIGHKPPYSNKHQIPTIAHYRQEKEFRKEVAREHQPESTDGGAADGRELSDPNHAPGAPQESHELRTDAQGNPIDTSETTAALDPKQRRKDLKKGREERAERQVTDPVTHLPVTIHDFTSEALRDVSENEAPFGTTARSATGLSNKSKSQEVLDEESSELRRAHDSIQALFPPPHYDSVRREIAGISKLGVTVVVVGTFAVAATAFVLYNVTGLRPLARLLSRNEALQRYADVATWGLLGVASIGCVVALIFGVRDWMQNRIDRVWEEEIWSSRREGEEKAARAHDNETTVWLNSLLASVWPLVNPDLFLSLADTLEDVMQASLPKMVQMVSVDDIGQGSESIRILGIKWLPTGAAARSVNDDGSLKEAKDGSQPNDRQVPGKGSVEDIEEGGNAEKGKDDGGKTGQRDDGSQQQIAEGMEAEEGDFVNLEVAFAYRARTGTKFRDRAKAMHLYMAFYLPGKIKVPVWVNLRGIVGVMRLRLQLCPDPPFFSLCTLTFLGQPKVDLSCVPLSKHALNIMDVPLISNFVQSAVDAAMAEYVAPKSLNLDLKDMLAGDDFKKDTHARGVLVVHIRRGYDFKFGDPSIPLVKKGSSDPYVSVGWAKFGKPVWSTRILLDEMEPVWDETAYLLVTPEELNVDERLRVQLWDSDRMTADDDLGRIEVDIKHLMRSTESNGKMRARTDGFRALKAGEDMPGKLEWSVGYFAKAGLQDCQLQAQTFDPAIRSPEQLRRKVDEVCDRKLREANVKKGRHGHDADELQQQRAQEMKAEQDGMIISAPPPRGYPSGIFGIQIHQITGLELERPNNDYGADEHERGEGLPSAYCNVIINDTNVFKTRTKPKNAKPFYNAGTERFVADWRNAHVYVSVRDARLGEDDPLLGIVHLPLGEVFRSRAQINGFYPLAGGVGFGRVRLSLVWRSIELQAPPEAIGWDLGTVEVQPSVRATDGLPADLQRLKLKLHTDLAARKMYPSPSHDGAATWAAKNGQSLKLPVRRRYASCLAIHFRASGVLHEKTAAFAVFWPREIADGGDAAREVTLPVWKGGDVARATKCPLDSCGEKVGSITLGLTFWNGLGSAHSRWASKEPGLRNVVEVLDTALDNLEDVGNAEEVGVVGDVDGSSSSESDSSDDESRGGAEHGTDGAAGPVDGLKARLKHEKALHRRNRGLMQWRAPRTAQWAAHKVERTGSRLSDMFKHHTRHQGVETET